MNSSPVNAFEYVSILVSIILGLGITQILSSFSDLLYQYKRVRFYWPHTLWICFVLFLHIQDWFVTWQLRAKAAWHLPELLFVLSYPVSLFITAKMLLPTNEREATFDMKTFYHSQSPVIFFLTAISVLVSVLFNYFLLGQGLAAQWHLLLFLGLMVYMALRSNPPEWLHRAVALIICGAALLSAILEADEWVIG